MKGLIVASGEIKNLNILKNVAKSADYIICADGGANYMAKVNINPDLIIGDLDSIDKETFDLFEREDIKFARFPEKKDFTDAELAVEFLVDKSADEVVLMGATGTRLDHTMANILLLYKLLKKGIKGQIISEKNTIYITDDILKLTRKDNTFVSVIPINDEGAKITLKGFEYETYEKKFDFLSTYGISNRIVEKKGIIEVKDGVCIVMESRD